MKNFREALTSEKFIITAESGPPKGTNVKEMIEHLKPLKDRVNGVNVTDNQSSVMRLGSLGAAKLILDAGLDPIYQLTCRDRNRLALQSDLLSAHVLGIRQVLCLTGDHVAAGDHPEAKPVFDLESVQLLELVGRMNGGKDLSTRGMRGKKVDGLELDGALDLLPGAVVTPEQNPITPQLYKFEKKVAAGARFFQTQAVYDLDRFRDFMATARLHKDVKVLAGILLLKSAGMAKYLNNFVPGICVPQNLIDELDGASDKMAKGIEIAARFIKDVSGLCDGVHIMAIGAEDKVPEILDAAGL